MATGFPFVGREDVLGELLEARERAAAGRGGLVTLTGAAGAGKTRLAEEAAARAEGFRTVWTWCPPDAVEHALRPWSRLLRDLVVGDERCGRLVAASPCLNAVLDGSASGGLPGTDPAAARLRLAGDVSEILATVARRRPLLLVLDDVHAADASSLRLLLESADAVRGARVLLLATARDDDSAWQDRVWARAQLSRRGGALPVGPLRDEDVAALLDAATGGTPTPSAVRALARYTGGDAFFVTELLRSGGRLDGTRSGATEVSVRVRDAVRARTAGLSPRAARLLDLASLLGTRFRLDVLAEAAAEPLDQVRALLGEAEGAGLLTEAGADEGRFRHDLLREALSGRPAPAERAGLHRTLAAVLAERAGRDRATGPAEIAHHLLLSGPEHAREAAMYCREAAEGAAAPRVRGGGPLVRESRGGVRGRRCRPGGGSGKRWRGRGGRPGARSRRGTRRGAARTRGRAVRVRGLGGGPYDAAARRRARPPGGPARSAGAGRAGPRHGSRRLRGRRGRPRAGRPARRGTVRSRGRSRARRAARCRHREAVPRGGAPRIRGTARRPRHRGGGHGTRGR